jgi:hypothetical protein
MVDSDEAKLLNWTAFVFFNKGCTMMYAGEEFSDTNLPSLFDKDLVNWDGYDLSPLVKVVSKIVKDDITVNGVFDFEYQEKDVIVASYKYDNSTLYGVFNVGQTQGEVTLKNVENGIFTNLIDGSRIEVSNNTLNLSEKPLIFEVKESNT